MAVRPTLSNTSAANTDVSVSVVMPIKAPAPWLESALDSIVHQTRTASEIICVVDGRDPDLITFLNSREGVKVLVNEISRGPADARNLGINSATGDYIALLDSDDKWTTTHLEQLTSELRENPGLLVVGSRAVTVDEQGRPHGSVGGRAGASSAQLLIRNQFVNSGTLFHRETALALGSLNPRVRVCEDYDLWLRLASVGPVRMVAGSPTVLYRMTSTGVSRERINQESRQAIRASRRKLGRSLKLPLIVPDFFQWTWEQYLDFQVPSLKKAG